jgi:hypothetical protein
MPAALRIAMASRRTSAFDMCGPTRAALDRG